ncbi:hypothetical protein [Peterkaempfera bronchialis]|uniref:Uncharacterized protein n=1 Tax=Peterkaempfera bronchialis TaxID=2126346 RepID=A0A345SWF9_9ACTN|nr:hypothetical protein [Peterkaempfera bronchialis]AXI78064.1 hypothetical protein C7M71_012040 [Peterkaempfera bronchialis]
MAALPEDIIDRLDAMERRLQRLSTAVVTRPAGGRTGTTVQRLYDAKGHEVVSGDPVIGGLGRPWLAMLPPQDSASARWPQTTATVWTTIARSFNPVWQPGLRLYMATSVSSGCTGAVRVLLNGTPWGDPVAAGSTFDRTGPVAADFNAVFGTLLRVEVQAQVTDGTGTVHAQPQLMYGTQI